MNLKTRTLQTLYSRVGILLILTTMISACQSSDSTSILLQGGRVVDSESGTIKRADVLIQGDRIVAVDSGLSAPQARIIDCKGQIVTAGFVDSHVHIESSMVLPHAFGQAVLPHGTTTVIADPHEAVNVGGAKALTYFLEQAKKACINIYTVVPSSVPATPYDTNGAGKFLASDMKPFVNRDDVVGLGEVMCYNDVAAENPEILEKIALFKHKTIDGHTAGMQDELLDAYVKAGIQNDHECSDTAAMLRRYERGMNIYVREGSAARNAQALLSCVKERGLDVNRFAFCTDDKHLATIAREGHISYIVRMARQLGFSWVEVARMASLNPCRFYHLEKLGNVRPGYRADIIVTDDSCQYIAHVLKSGVERAAYGSLMPVNACQNPEADTTTFENTVKFKTLTAKDFEVPRNLQHIAIALVDNQLLTLPHKVKESERASLTRLATVERYGKNGNVAVCLLKGYGIRNGAVATSVSHDSHNVVCAGDNPTDMAVACNRLRELQGGYVIASQGKVTGEFPLPCLGLMSTLSAQEAADSIAAMEQQAHQMGVNPRIDAFTTLSFTALPVIPTLRLLDTGLFDVLQNKFIQ